MPPGRNWPEGTDRDDGTAGHGAVDPGAEPVEVVDEGGTVTDVVPRRLMRAGNLRHRCTYVAVVVGPSDLFDPGAGPPSLGPDSEVVVHQRAAWKDTFASHWDLAFGGVCGVGEPWVAAAERELAEEAGIMSPLVDLGPCRYEDRATRIVGRIFVTAWPDEPISNDGEAVAFDRVRLGELGRWLASVPVCPDSAAVVGPRLLALLP